MKIEQLNLDGAGAKPTRVHGMRSQDDYWRAVTDVPCPITRCRGIIRWAEAGYAPGYRICDYCLRHFQALGDRSLPTLAEIGRRGGPIAKQLQRSAAARALGAGSASKAGKAGRGDAKVRGASAHYRALAAKSAEARRDGRIVRESRPLKDESAELDAQRIAALVDLSQGEAGDWKRAGYRSKLAAALVLVGAGGDPSTLERAACLVAARMD